MNKLTAITFPTPEPKEYKKGSVEIAPNSESFIKNDRTIGTCDITKCELRDKTCTESFTKDDTI